MAQVSSVESVAVYRRRLGAKAAKLVIDGLCGSDRSAADRLRAFVVGLPAAWKAQYTETLPERRRRQARLTRTIRSAAAAIAADPEYSHLSLIELRDIPKSPPQRPEADYEIQFLTSRATNRPTCAELLTHVANEVERPRSSDAQMISSRRGVDLKPFCLLALHYRLVSWPRFQKRRPPHRQVELLVGALLRQTIPKDTLTHVLGPNARRKYTKDSE